MSYIVDTHVLIWSFTNPEKLTSKIREALLNDDDTIYFSQFSLFEISIKYNLGKLQLKKRTPEQFFKVLNNSFYVCKRIENEELVSFYKLPIEHRDPFDRAIIWQAIQNGLTLISYDDKISLYGKHGLKCL